MNTGMESKECEGVSREKCEKVVKETISLLGMLGSVSSGMINTTVTLFTSIISYIAIVVSITTLLKDVLSPVWMIIVISISIYPFSMFVTQFIIRELRRTRIYSETRISRGAIEGLLISRKSILESCKDEICRGDASKDLLCLDIDKLSRKLDEIRNDDP